MGVSSGDSSQNCRFMVKVQFNAWEFDMPERWEECSLEQIAKLSPLIHWKIEDITETEQEYAVFILLGCSPQFWNELTLEVQQYQALVKIARFAFEQKIVERPFAEFKHQGITYYVFEESFANSDAVDVAWANMQYLAFANPDEPNLDALDELLATLCRPARNDLHEFQLSKDWDGDIREPYNGQRVKARAKEFKSLDIGIKIALLQYFESQNTLFLESYANMMGDDGRAPRYENGMGWVTMLMSVAEKGTFGNFEAVCHQNVHLVWTKCLDDTLEAKEQERLMEAQRLKS